jgi:hypothetical protein
MPPSFDSKDGSRNHQETSKAFVYSSVLNMETVCSPETCANFYQTRRCLNAEDILYQQIPARSPSQTRINRLTGENYANLSSMRKREGEQRGGTLRRERQKKLSCFEVSCAVTDHPSGRETIE